LGWPGILGGNGEVHFGGVEELAFGGVEEFDADGLVGGAVADDDAVGFGDGVGGGLVEHDEHEDVGFGFVFNFHGVPLASSG
jgi:hypothetical protein